MIACNTDGTIVIVSCVHMVMRNSHEGGKKEQNYKKSCKAAFSGHGATLTHDGRLRRWAGDVKYYIELTVSLQIQERPHRGFNSDSPHLLTIKKDDDISSSLVCF
jgi:hypothetical protein